MGLFIAPTLNPILNSVKEITNLLCYFWYLCPNYLPRHVFWGFFFLRCSSLNCARVKINAFNLEWPNGVKCREWAVDRHARNLACRYGCWLRGVCAGVAGVWVLWKESDSAVSPGAVCVGWHLPCSSNPVFLQLHSYCSSPSFFHSFHPSIPP